MTVMYVCEIEKGIYRTFTKESILKKFLSDKTTDWLKDFFDNGNEIGVAGKHYSYVDCLNLM